jgi:membrane-associated HD superfamily phosphohydrolase
MSYEVITRHVSDSVLILLGDHNFPREIIEIISQHHGTTVLKYFYKKNKDENKNSDDFRYKCSRPKTLESMVLIICDQIEATSRSLVQAGKFNPVEVIDNTINGLISDGQLDAVTLKLGDLKLIKESLGKELEGIYQKRVNYNEVGVVGKGD